MGQKSICTAMRYVFYKVMKCEGWIIHETQIKQWFIVQRYVWCMGKQIQKWGEQLEGLNIVKSSFGTNVFG